MNLSTDADSIIIAIERKKYDVGIYLFPSLSPVTCHMSPVTFHVSPVTCHLSHFITKTATVTDPPLCNTCTMHCSWTENTKKLFFFFNKQKNQQKYKNSKTSKEMPNLAILHPLIVKVFKSETTPFHHFPPRVPNL